MTLPQSYSAQHWQLTWVGFDMLLLAFMIGTAVLGELPLAAVLLVGTVRIARLQVPSSSRAWWLFAARRRPIGRRSMPRAQAPRVSRSQSLRAHR